MIPLPFFLPHHSTLRACEASIVFAKGLWEALNVGMTQSH